MNISATGFRTICQRCGKILAEGREPVSHGYCQPCADGDIHGLHSDEQNQVKCPHCTALLYCDCEEGFEHPTSFRCDDCGELIHGDCPQAARITAPVYIEAVDKLICKGCEDG